MEEKVDLSYAGKAKDMIDELSEMLEDLVSYSNSYIYHHENYMKTKIKDGSFLKEEMIKKILGVMEDE